MSNRQNLRSAHDTLGDLVSDFQPSNYSNLQISVFHQAYAALHGAEYNATMGIYDVANLSQITQQLDYLILMLERQFQGQAVVQHQVRVNNHFEAIGEALDRSPTPVDPNLCDVSEELWVVSHVDQLKLLFAFAKLAGIAIGAVVSHNDLLPLALFSRLGLRFGNV